MFNRKLHVTTTVAIMATTMTACHKQPASDNPSNTATVEAPSLGADPCAGLRSDVEEISCRAKVGDAFARSELPGAPAPKIDCSGVTGQQAPANSPPDDILGVRQGMKPEAARAVLACASPPFTLDPDGSGGNFETPPMPDGSSAKSGFNAERGGKNAYTPAPERMQVLYVGLPGREIVAGVSRSEIFPAGQQPSFDSLQSSLVSKYGSPGKSYPPAGNPLPGIGTQISWVRKPDGSTMAPTDQFYDQCASSGMSASPDCGLVIKATITRSSDNASAVSGFTISVIDEAPVFSIADKDTSVVKAMRGSGGAVPKL